MIGSNNPTTPASLHSQQHTPPQVEQIITHTQPRIAFVQQPTLQQHPNQQSIHYHPLTEQDKGSISITIIQNTNRVTKEEEVSPRKSTENISENISENSRQRNNYHIVNNVPVLVQQQNEQSNRNMIPMDNVNTNRYNEQSHMSHIENNRKINNYKSLNNMRNITQESFAASQKNIVFNHYTDSQASTLIQQHPTVHTPQHQPLSLEYHHEDQQNQQRKHHMFNSYTPTNNTHSVVQNPNANAFLNPNMTDRGMPSTEIIFWKAKYQQILRQHESLKVHLMKEQELGFMKMGELQKRNVLIQQNFNSLRHEYQIILQKNRILSIRNEELQRQLSLKVKQEDGVQKVRWKRELELQREEVDRLRVQLGRMQRKDEESKTMVVEQSHYKNELEEKMLLLSLLKKENLDLNMKLKNLQKDMKALHDNHNQLLLDHQELGNYASALQDERDQQQQVQLQDNNQHESFIQEQEQQVDNHHLMVRKNDVSQIISVRSRHDSNNDNNNRIIDLQMHVAKLKTDLHLREEAYERQLKMANLSILQLIDKIKSNNNERDQVIKSLQEKMSIIETELFKKESLIRSLRQQIANGQAKNHPRNIAISNSSINSAERHNQKQEVYKRELENVRKNLFEKEREKLILMQKYEEMEYRVNENQDILNKKKIENQAIRRQLNELDNLQHENDKLLEVIHKKNEEILQMKMMVKQKENNSGEYQILNAQNQKLRQLMLKKNDQISELAERLFNEQKKIRQMQQQFNRRIEEYQDDIQRLNDILNRKDQQINGLEGQGHQLQFEVQEFKNVMLEYENAHGIDEQKIKEYEQYFKGFQEEIQHYDREMDYLNDKIKESYEEITNKTQLYNEATTNIDMLNLQINKQNLQLSNIQQKNQEFRSGLSKQFQQKFMQVQGKYKQMQGALRLKQMRLAKSGEEMEGMQLRLKKHTNCEREIEKLSTKVKEYELKILNMIVNRNHSKHNTYQSQQIFQNKLIYRLQANNQQLQAQLQQVNISSTPITHQQNQPNQRHLHQRLEQFNEKLTQTIFNEQSPSRTLNHQNINIQTTSNGLSVDASSNKLKKQRTNTIQDQLKSIDKFYESSNTEIVKILQQRLQFYQQKNIELEESVNSHIKKNKELKTMIQKKLSQGTIQLKLYYESQLQQKNNQIQRLKHAKSVEKYQQTRQDSSYGHGSMLQDLKWKLQNAKEKKGSSYEYLRYNFNVKKNSFLS